MNTNQILVTGGTGSLGSRVVKRLSEAGDKVRVMSRYRHANTIRGDLLTGEGPEEAVEGVSTIIHCASSSLRKTRQVDVDGTRRLLWAAERAGVSHLLFISIVGVDRNPYFPYYRMKLETERIIEHSEVPWTILRATQFHGFVLRLIQALDRLPTMVAPRGFLLQPIDVGEVADRSAELALAGPAGRAPDVGGRRCGPSLTSRGRTPRPLGGNGGSWRSPCSARFRRLCVTARRRRRTTGTARSAGKSSWRSIKTRAKGTM